MNLSWTYLLTLYCFFEKGISRISSVLQKLSMKPYQSNQVPIFESWYRHIEQSMTLTDIHVCKIATFSSAKTGERNLVIGHFVIYFGEFGLFFDKVNCTVVKDKASVFLESMCSPLKSMRRWLPVYEWYRQTDCQLSLCRSPPLSLSMLHKIRSQGKNLIHFPQKYQVFLTDFLMQIIRI